MNDTLQVIAIAAGALLVLGLPLGLLLRAGRRSLARQRAELEAAPLARFELDLELLQAFKQSVLRDAATRRRAMAPFTLKLLLWLAAFVVPACTALGAWRTHWLSGLLVGLALVAIVAVPVAVAVGFVAWLNWRGERAARAIEPRPARMHVGLQGISMQPGAFMPIIGQLQRVELLAGPPLVLQLVSSSPDGSGGNNWYYASGPVAAADRERALQVVEQLRARIGGKGGDS